MAATQAGQRQIADLSASKVTSGIFATARLGSGTANTSKYLRGDGSWQDLVTSQITTGAVVDMLAISSPVNGQLFYCTDYLIGTHQYNGSTWEYLAPYQSEIYRQNFTFGTSQGTLPYFTRGGSGTGNFGDRAYEQSGLTKSGTYYYLVTGTTTTGYANLGGVGNGIGGSSTKLFAFQSRVCVPLLSTASQEIIVKIGSAASALIYLVYDRLNRGTTWYLYANGTYTDTTVTVDTNWHDIVLLVDLAALTCKVYVDQILKVTVSISSTLRASSSLISGFRIDKTAGTTSIAMYMEYTGAWCYKN